VKKPGKFMVKKSACPTTTIRDFYTIRSTGG